MTGRLRFLALLCAAFDATLALTRGDPAWASAASLDAALALAIGGSRALCGGVAVGRALLVLARPDAAVLHLPALVTAAGALLGRPARPPPPREPAPPRVLSEQPTSVWMPSRSLTPTEDLELRD